MKVRKAVIPAAGWGTRLLPATKALPKEMLPVVDRPAIEYVVMEAVAAGIEEILFVTSRTKTQIADHFDSAPALERELVAKERHDLLQAVRASARMAHCVFVRQPELRGLGDAIRCAQRFVGNEPFAVLLPDDLVDAPEPCLRQLVRVHDAVGGSVLAVQTVEPHQVSSYGIIQPGSRLGRDVLQVKGLVEKPEPEAAPSDLAVVGRYILSPRIFHHLGCLLPGRGGELQLTDALQLLVAEEPIHACQFKGQRYDVGNTLGLLQANIAFALARADLAPGLLAYLEDVLPTRLPVA